MKKTLQLLQHVMQCDMQNQIFFNRDEVCFLTSFGKSQLSSSRIFFILFPTEEPDEDEDDENSEESVEDESEEDLTETPKTSSTQPPYSLIPPPPVWVQRNQGLSMRTLFLNNNFYGIEHDVMECSSYRHTLRPDTFKLLPLYDRNKCKSMAFFLQCGAG